MLHWRRERASYRPKSVDLRLAALVVSVLLTWAVAQLPAQVAGAERAAQSLVYRGPGEVAFEVTPAGLSSIRVGQRELAKGGWSVFNAEGWFRDPATQKVQAEPAGERSIRVLDDRWAVVRHVSGDLVCEYDYQFDGEDVTISALVQNRNVEAALEIVGFSGLTFDFDQPPGGIMPVAYVSYLRRNGVGLCYPSDFSRIGGSYAIDGSIGVGVSPWNTGLMRSLIMWDYTDWRQDKRQNVPSRRLVYFAVTTVPPRGAVTLDLKLRVSGDRDWRHLLEPYREHFRKLHGPVQYKADERWIASDYLNHGGRTPTPLNPYAFHDGYKRVDLPQGVRALCDRIIPPLKRAGGQGIIFWGQTGTEPRGEMYRADFDVLPPPVEENWPALVQRFREAGLKVGVAARPGDLAVRLDWAKDQTLRLNVDDPAHREMVWKRFDNMIRKGCTLFYLDSFGYTLEDVKLMRFLRERMGPGILTFAEQQCDAMLVYSGGYSETTFEGEATPSHYRLWSRLDNWEVYQWLAPGAQMASRLAEIKGKMGSDAQSPARFFHQHGITPLVPVHQFDTLVKLSELQEQNGPTSRP